MKVLVTGASGFIASHLLPLLLKRGCRVCGAVRNEERISQLPPRVEGIEVGELSPDTDWSKAAAGADVIVHLAARVHFLGNSQAEAYNRVNVDASRELAETAARLGVRRLVFVSSVKAMGEASLKDFPWTEEKVCCPQDSYGKSKLDAELALREVTASTKMELVIVRSPVVYGAGVVANIYRLLQVIDRGWPLPLASVENRRSLIYVRNLVDAIIKVVEHPKAAGEMFLVSDGKDVSTPELLRAIAQSLGKSANIFPTRVILGSFLLACTSTLSLALTIERNFKAQKSLLFPPSRS